VERGRAEGEIDYFVCDDEAALLYSPTCDDSRLHVWRAGGSLEQPDCASWTWIPRRRRSSTSCRSRAPAHRLCEDIELPSSSRRALDGASTCCCRWRASSPTSSVARWRGSWRRVVAAELPEISTITRQVGKRGGKVYIDYVQNGHGRCSSHRQRAAAAGRAGVDAAQVDEVTAKLDMRAFTIKTAVPDEAAEEDPLLPLLTPAAGPGGAITRAGAASGGLTPLPVVALLRAAGSSRSRK